MDLKALRNRLRISQTRLAQLSDVGRFKIALYELGEGKLTDEEESRIESALRDEARRISTEMTSFQQGLEGRLSIAE